MWGSGRRVWKVKAPTEVRGKLEIRIRCSKVRHGLAMHSDGKHVNRWQEMMGKGGSESLGKEAMFIGRVPVYDYQKVAAID